MAEYPKDADGDVFRRMAKRGFDFSVPVKIDFNIDFDHWPLLIAEVDAIQSVYPTAAVVQSDNPGSSGYVSFAITDFLTYDLVIRVQGDASRLVKSFGGLCESWGVLH